MVLGRPMMLLVCGAMTGLACVAGARDYPTRPSAPEVPTVSEAGLAGFEADNWNALLAPRGTPKRSVDRLNLELEKLLKLPDIQSQFIKIGAEALYSMSPELAARIKEETVKWGKVARAAGVKPE